MQQRWVSHRIGIVLGTVLFAALAAGLLGLGIAGGRTAPLPHVSAVGLLGVQEAGFDALLYSSVDVPEQCVDGIDNDGDGSIDLADRGCVDAFDLWEQDPVPKPMRRIGVERLADGHPEVESVWVSRASYDGVAVGYVNNPEELRGRIFRWEDGVLELLDEPEIGLLDSGWSPGFVSISGDGRVVSVGGRAGYYDDPRSFRWEDGAWTEVENPEGFAYVTDLDFDGGVMVGKASTPAGSIDETWVARWDDGALTLLSPVELHKGTVRVSPDGSVTTGLVYRYVASEGRGYYEPAAWTGTDPNPRFLFDASPPPNDPLWPPRRSVGINDVSESGAKIAIYGSYGGPETYAYLWEDGAIRLLGHGLVYGLSDDGRIAGGWGPSIWDASGNQRSVADMLVNDYGLGLDGWELDPIFAMSGDGRSVFGWGIDPDGRLNAWALRLPAQCRDGLDNDGDALVDFGNDPGCAYAVSDAEDGPVCGIGFELALLLPPLMWLRRRRARL